MSWKHSNFVPVSKQEDKKLWYTYTMEYSRKKEGAPTLCDSMDGTGEHYAKWNKPGSERQIPYDLIYEWNLINKTKNEQIEPETWK